jgi:Glycosyltransferase family 87
MSGAMHLQARWLIAIAAVLLSENSLGWDFRNHNTNIVYLALVMVGIQTRRTWPGALLLALSINLNLYSGLVPIALAWRREYALAAATCVLTVLIAVLPPVVAFGPSAFPQLTADWIAQIRYSIASQSGHTASLIRSVATLLAADPGAVLSTVTLRAVQAAWLVLVACYYVVAARRQPAQAIHYDQARLADICVAFIAPLPLSV